jgi:hypothetical protein
VAAVLGLAVFSQLLRRKSPVVELIRSRRRS